MKETKKTGVGYRGIMFAVLFALLAGAVYAFTQSVKYQSVPLEIAYDNTPPVDESNPENTLSTSSIDEFILRIYGELSRDSSGYSLKPVIEPDLVNKNEMRAFEDQLKVANKQNSIYKIETLDVDGDHDNYFFSLSYCPLTPETCITLESLTTDTLPVGKSARIVSDGIIIDEDVVGINVYVGDTMIYSLNRPEKIPAVTHFNKKPQLITENDVERPVMHYSWEIDGMNQGGFSFEYSSGEDTWRRVGPSEHADASEIEVDLTTIETSKQNVDIRLTVTDGFHAFSVTEKNSFPVLP